MGKEKYFVLNFSNGKPSKELIRNIEITPTEDPNNQITVKLQNGNFDSKEIQQKMNSYYICKLKKGQIKVHKCKMLMMIPSINNSLRAIKSESNVDRSSMSYIEKTEKLAEEFGSKQMKRDIRSLKRQEALSASAVENIKESVDKYREIADKNIFADSQNDENNILPKRSKSIKIDEIYDINELIPPKILKTCRKSLNDFCFFCKNNQTELPSFLLRRHKQIISENSDVLFLSRCLFWYYLHLFYTHLFFSASLDSVSNNAYVQSIPARMMKYLKKNFLVFNQFSPTMKTKCRAHLIIIAMYISDFCINISDFEKDLKMKRHMLKPLFRQIGCEISQEEITEENPTAGNSSSKKIKTFVARLIIRNY